jgi:hypothetical protein
MVRYGLHQILQGSGRALRHICFIPAPILNPPRFLPVRPHVNALGHGLRHFILARNEVGWAMTLVSPSALNQQNDQRPPR